MSHHRATKQTRVADLTVGQLQHIIRTTVQQAVAEVIIEMQNLREMDEDELVAYEAELTEYVQSNLNASSETAWRKHDD
jgi:uncharacterized NAD-dependent epimerase/dehydratase family protein